MSEPLESTETVTVSRPIPSSDVIYAGLFSRPQTLSFHWTIIIPSGNGSVTMFQVLDNEGNWSYIRRERHNLYESNHICVLINLGGSVTKKITVDVINQLLKSIPMSVPAVDRNREKRFSCRVWFREALRLLDEYDIISCPDVDTFEKKATRLGLTQMPKTNQGRGYEVHAAAAAA